MYGPLLLTKLYQPPLRAGLVARRRVTERLARGLAEGRRLTLISAPAGYGKTTLAVEWLASLAGAGLTGRAHAGEWAVSWLALDEGDNDPARFVAYLVAALRKADPAIGQTTLDLMAAQRLPAMATLMTALINDVALSGRPILLVLDDYHAIHSASIHEAVEFMCQHAPPLLLHLALLTRADPPLALATLRAGGQMTEVRGDDLRFTGAEAAAFFAQTMGVELEAGAARTLAARTEGWIAGLQLAALSVQGCDSSQIREFVAAFSGSDRYIMDYLVEQVLRRVAPETRAFLCQTAILERFCAPLCNAILADGAHEHHDSREMLARLDQANLFLVRLDTQGQWYRFHHLFAELLRLELDEGCQAALHGRAMAWLETNGYLPEAIDHALAAGRHADAARLIRAAAGELLARSEFQSLLGWIERLPASLVAADGELAVHRAHALLFTGAVEQAACYLEQLAGASSGMLPATRGRLLTLRAFLASLRSEPAAGELAAQALSLIGDDDAFYQMAALLPLGLAQNAAGDTAHATETFRDTVALGENTGHSLATLAGLFMLAKNLLDMGRRREALAACEEALPRYLDRRGEPLPLAGLIYHPLSMIHYHGNDLDAAWECAVTGLRLARQIISEDVLGWDEERVIASIQYARGDGEAALATARRIRQAAEKTHYVRGMVGLRSLEAELLLRSGDLAAVSRWAEYEHYRPDDIPAAEREMAYRVYARYLVADGRPEEARVLLVTLEQRARSGQRYGRLIAFQILRSTVEEMLGNHRQAMDYMAEAVRLAAPEGYVRLFLDAGETTLPLLRQVRVVAPQFVDELAGGAASNAVPAQGHALAQAAAPCPGSSQGLVEPLSAREIEVLALLAEGRSYREIADALIVAMGTVRAHCSSIYGKLGVGNRTQAILRAKEAGLL